MFSRMLKGYTLVWISILIRNVIKNKNLYKTVSRIEITTRIYRGGYSKHSLFVGNNDRISAMPEFFANYFSFRCGYRTMKTQMCTGLATEGFYRKMSRQMSGFPLAYIRVFYNLVRKESLTLLEFSISLNYHTNSRFPNIFVLCIVTYPDLEIILFCENVQCS